MCGIFLIIIIINIKCIALTMMKTSQPLNLKASNLIYRNPSSDKIKSLKHEIRAMGVKIKFFVSLTDSSLSLLKTPKTQI